jgi:hypothetical protein
MGLDRNLGDSVRRADKTRRVLVAMSAEFDPYRKWLGIPPDELPPDHYRLLGIARFEDDPDVIENAANRQMAHVRTFQSGRHGQFSQQILNELSAARICLLNADKKQAYDAHLRAQLAAAAPAPPAGVSVAAPPPVMSTPPVAAPPVTSPQAAAQPAPAVGIPAPMVPRGPIPQGVAAPSPVGSTLPSNGAPAKPQPLVATSPVRSRASAAVRHAARRRSSPVPLVLGLIGAAILIGAVVVVLNSDLAKPRVPAEPEANRPRPAGGLGGGERPTLRPRPAPASPSRPTASNPQPDRTDFPAPSVAETPGSFDTFPPATPPTPPLGEQVYREAVQSARAALADRDTRRASLDLERAAEAQQTPSQIAEVERLKALSVYLDGFWDGVRRAITKDLEAGTAFEHQGKQYELVSHEGNVVKYKADGNEMERPIQELEVAHALAFASKAFAEDDVFGKVYVAALLVLDRQSSANAEYQVMARKLLAEAAQLSGNPNPYVAGELGIEPATLRPNSAPGTTPADPETPAGTPLGGSILDPPGNGTTKPAARSAVPEAAAVSAAHSQLNQMYADDYESIRRDREQRGPFVAKLLADSGEQADVTLRYAMLSEACDQAVKASETELLMQSVDALASRFELDLLEQKATYLHKLVMNSDFDGAKIMELAGELRELAESQQRLDVAIRLVEIAIRGANKINDDDSVRELNARLPDLKKSLALQKREPAASPP